MLDGEGWVERIGWRGLGGEDWMEKAGWKEVGEKRGK